MTSVKLSLREGNSVAKAVFHSTLGQWVIGENVWLPFLCFLYWAQPCSKFQTWFSGIQHFPDVSVWCKWGPLELTFGFKLLVLVLPVFSLPITCKRRFFFLPLSHLVIAIVCVIISETLATWPMLLNSLPLCRPGYFMFLTIPEKKN